MALPGFILGTDVHYYTGGECQSATLTHKDSQTQATLDINRFDPGRTLVDQTSPATVIGPVTYDADPAAPADGTFHFGQDCPFST